MRKASSSSSVVDTVGNFRLSPQNENDMFASLFMKSPARAGLSFKAPRRGQNQIVHILSLISLSEFAKMISSHNAASR
jgi:hypothetical protein